jgi:predicted nuclease with TOPRIM domain
MSEAMRERAIELEDECYELKAEVRELRAENAKLREALKDVQEGCRIGESHMHIDYVVRKALES